MPAPVGAAEPTGAASEAVPAPPYGLAAASREVRRQQRLAEQQTEEYARLHHALACIDEVLELIEERNLDGVTGVDRELRHRLGALEGRVSVAPPPRLVGVRTVSRAHALLLDRQQELVGELSAPGSLAATFVADRDEEEDPA